MKNVLVGIISFIVFLFIYFLQLNFFNWFNIAGIMPNLFVVLVLFLGLYSGEKNGLFLGILFGLFLDITMSKKIGITALMFAIIGLLGVYFDKNFSKDNRIVMIGMVAGSTLIFEVGSYALNAIILSYNVEILAFVKILAIETIFNILLTIILSPLLKKIGYAMENMYKSTQILTRYF